MIGESPLGETIPIEVGETMAANEEPILNVEQVPSEDSGELALPVDEPALQLDITEPALPLNTEPVLPVTLDDEPTTEEPSTLPVEPEPVQNGAVEDTTPTYAEAFPPLPGAGGPQPSGSAWATAASGGVKKAPPKNKAIQSSTVSQVFRVPYEERRFKNLMPIVGSDIDSQNDAIRDVMAKTGTKIEVSITKDQSLTIVVSGKREGVSNARSQILRALQTQASIEIEIPREHHRFILGRGGKKLQDLELATATRINIPRDSDIIRIVGTKEGIDRARHEMQVISDEQAKLAFERVNIPKIYHPFICGANNTTAKDIANRTGARINIPPPSVDKDELTVAGEKEGVQAAVKMITDIYKDKEKRCKTVAIEVKKQQHRYVIGPRGAGIQDILQLSGVSVEVPPFDSDSETVTLRGEPDKLGNALSLVYEKANSIVSTEVAAPRWLHRYIIGRSGENIKKISADLEKLHIEFVEAKDLILLEGPPGEVQQAEALLESSISKLNSTLQYVDVEVDRKWHRHIIGKAGSNIARIKQETGTSINIPPDTENSNVIRIEGSPEGVLAAKEQIVAMASKMDNEKTKDIIIEQRFHKNIIGQKGEKVREIREQFGEVQISFPDAGKKSDIVSLRGPKDEVDKCFAFLKKLAADLVASNHRVEVPIFKRFHGNIIGRNGATIKKIKEDTGTTIEIPTENSASDVIVIIGFKEKCEEARDRIQAIQSELANIVSSEVNIAQSLHTSLIGAGGKLIQSIMTECGDVHIHFPPEGEKSDKITIRGTKEDVEKAEQQLVKLAGERQENSFTAEVNAKAEHHRYIIGRGGANIRKFRESTGVRVIFPTASDEKKDVITLIGKEEAVLKAKGELEEKIKDLDNVVESEVSIDPKHHRHFVSRRAQVLRDIADEFGGVAVSFPRDANSTRVTVKGAKDCVEGAKARLLEIVNDLESQVELKCVIPQKHHRAILGAKGANVQQVTSKFQVQIKFPERAREADPQAEPMVNGNSEHEPAAEPAAETGDNACDIILITGKKESAEGARDELLSLVPVAQQVDIPFDNHRFIIGQKGAGIRNLMNQFDVNIAVPSSDKQSETITVTGLVANVEQAIEALKKKNGEIEQENEDRKLRQFQMKIDVPAVHHPKLIGRRGMTITKLRQEHDVNIQVPNPDQKTDVITLIGYESKCKAAADAILGMIKELEDQVSLEVHIDNRVHSRIIGQKGRAVRKIMDQYKVDIRFPRTDGNPDLVVISGAEDACEECKEHLILLEEEYMEDVRERQDERDLMSSYMVNRNPSSGGRGGNQSGEFVVKDAPWSAPAPRNAPKANFNLDASSPGDFPSLGGPAVNGGTSKPWGPWGQ